MAINGRLLVGDELAHLSEECRLLMASNADLGTLELFHDRSASFDSFSKMLHAPRKDPTKNRAKAIIVRECKCDLAPLNLAIEKCSEATSILLERNELRSEGIASILQVLKNRTNVEVLAIRRNFIGDKGAKEIAKLLAGWKNTLLHTLYLGYCNIGKCGIEELCNSLSVPTASTLTRLDMTANFIKQDGAVCVGNLLRKHASLKVLNLGGNMLQDEGATEIFKGLAKNEGVTELNLSYNHIGERGIKVLAETLRSNCVLTQLNLNNNQVEEPGAMHLAQAMRVNTTLSHLSLNCNMLGDHGAEHMAGVLRWAAQLETLMLGDNAIGDAGANFISVHLAHKTLLRELDLDKNAVGDAGVEALVAAMKQRVGRVGAGKVSGVLRISNHAYGSLTKSKGDGEAKPADEHLEEAPRQKSRSPRGARRDSLSSDNGDRPRRKASLDTGNVKLKIEKKPQAPRPEGPLGELFKAWSAAPGQKGSKLAKSMDLKEFTEMLKALDVIPRRLSRLQVQELFRQANRAGAVSDGDNSELDWVEFEFAMRKVAEKVRTPLEDLVGDPKARIRAPSAPKSTNPSRAPSAEPTPRSRIGSRIGPEPNAELDVVFGFFAASEGQSKKRAASMDSREFTGLLEHLLLMPDKVSKTFAMECFTKGKKMSRDQSELDWNGFEWAMKRISKQVGIPYEEIHRFSQ